MRKCVLLSLDALYEEDLSHFGRGAFLGDWLAHAAVCTQVKTVFPALTYPAHTTLITGCSPAAHGIGQNQPFQPGVDAERRVWYWEAGQVKRPSLFDAVARAGGRCASILWPVTGKSRSIRWNFPEVLALPGENQILKMLRYGAAPWILHMELRHGRKRVSIHEPHLSDYAALLACDVIRRHKPELTAVHMVDLDEMRHRYGTHSAEAGEALNRLAHRVESVWQRMRQTPGMEDALLVLVSDHGQADVSRTVNLTQALSQAGLAGSFGVQSNGMSAFLIPTAPGAQSATLAAYFSDHREALGISHLYDQKELARLGCASNVALAVEAAPGVVFSDGLPQVKREKATHGFGPGHPAENCLFAVRGRGIREGVTVPSMPMQDVAPTLAALMGISMPQAEGNDRSELFRCST